MNQFTTGIFYSSELAPKILSHCEVMKTPQNRTTVIDIKHDGFFKMYLISNLASFWISIWMFPKIVGFPPKSPILIGVFHSFHHPFWGKIPFIFGSTPIYQKFKDCVMGNGFVPLPSTHPHTKHPLAKGPTFGPPKPHTLNPQLAALTLEEPAGAVPGRETVGGHVAPP